MLDSNAFIAYNYSKCGTSGLYCVECASHLLGFAQTLTVFSLYNK